jgi:nicotinate-nucleotide adenylyltransferase
MEELALERVLVVPARISPGKPVEEDPGPEHRLEMCRLAAAGVEGIEVCALEIEREGPSYTVDTLRELHAARPDIEITFILGADIARTLPRWHESSKLFALASFVVARRPDTESEPIGLPIGILKMPAIEISSSSVRERVRRGLPIAELVGLPVASYIAEHCLYHAPIGAARV